MPECPSYYYDSLESKSLVCQNESVYIQYGSGDVQGQECKDYLSSGDKKVNMDFLLQIKENDTGIPNYQL